MHLAIIQYAFEDFGIRQVAQLLGKEDDTARYTNRSLVSTTPLIQSLHSYKVSSTAMFGTIP